MLLLIISHQMLADVWSTDESDRLNGRTELMAGGQPLGIVKYG